MTIKANPNFRAYYNEINPFCCQWLQNLMDDGWITKGDIDRRSIEDVTPNDLNGYDRLHFFAGLGGWDYAFNLAGYDNSGIWSASCPCQPFSAAGKSAGFDDERHLWPALFHLITQCRPAVVCGEQVSSRDGLEWLNLVQADMEGLGYAIGAIVAPAAGLGAPHRRERQYWAAVDVADSRDESQGGRGIFGPGESPSAGARAACERPAGLCAPDHLADTDGERGDETRSGGDEGQREQWANGGFADCDGPGPTNGFWRDADWIFCRDNKWRPVEPGTSPLAYGLPRSLDAFGPGFRGLCDLAGVNRAALKRAKDHRVGTLRGWGNGIVAEQAAEFMRALTDSLGLLRKL